MEIHISNSRLKKVLEDDSVCSRKFGAEMARKIRLRLDALVAADSLGDFWPPLSKPERCHVLKGDKSGTFSMDLKHPYRLLFRATEPTEELPTSENAKQLWLAIKSIEILSIENTHG